MSHFPDFIKDFHDTMIGMVSYNDERELFKNINTLHKTVESIIKLITKEQRIIKKTIFKVIDVENKKCCILFQEKFHQQVDQMAHNYHIWKKTGCKTYAKPKQFVSTKITKLVKNAFDTTLTTYMNKMTDMGKNPITTIIKD